MTNFIKGLISMINNASGDNPRMRPNFWIIAGITFIILLVAAVGFYFALLASAGVGETQHFTVQSGQTITSIATNLKQDNLIKSVWGFKFWLKLTGKVIVQPGSYKISPIYSTPKIASIIASGDTANVTVTIPEGFTLTQIANLLGQKEVIVQEDFLEAANSFPPDYEFSKYRPAGQSLEGFLFPDTYRLIKGDITAVIRIMLDNFGAKYRNEIESDLGDKDLYKILIIASMVEREAKTQKDREQIAAVLYNRLEAGMRLDVDATVRYITDNWEDPITRTDLSIDSPYNTRRYAGLPPGPICNPGLASIKAVLNPPSSDYYYYLTDFEGITHYTETLQKHNENKLKYLL